MFLYIIYSTICGSIKYDTHACNNLIILYNIITELDLRTIYYVFFFPCCQLVKTDPKLFCTNHLEKCNLIVNN